jgi:hypothetical protein
MCMLAGLHRTGRAVSLSHGTLKEFHTLTFLVLQVWHPPRDFLWGLFGMKSAVMVGCPRSECDLRSFDGLDEPLLEYWRLLIATSYQKA